MWIDLLTETLYNSLLLRKLLGISRLKIALFSDYPIIA
jgi:hypothetical protein